MTKAEGKPKFKGQMNGDNCGPTGLDFERSGSFVIRIWIMATVVRDKNGK